jgi:DNA repair photolyase
MKTFIYQMKSGIGRTHEFERKRLAMYCANVGIKCGHGCAYCSTPSMVRMHVGFKCLGLSPFDNDYAIVDPTTHQRVAHDARRIKNRGMVQLCTIADAWSPEAQEYNLGRKCLEAILSEPGWTVRILTKNAAVENDFDLICKYRDRVLLGMSITGTPDKSNLISATEPYASPISERLRVMLKARTDGIRTYAMFCPLLPGIANGPDQIDELVSQAVEFGAEEIFAEAVNPRGRGLILTQEALAQKGFNTEAAVIESIRNKTRWSRYVADLIKTLQQSIREYYDIEKFRFLLYPAGLETNDLRRIKQDDDGVVWL